MSENEQIIKTAEDKMKKAVDVFQDELKSIRTGRPNPEIFKRVKVECYGSVMSLPDLASISVPDGKSFLIQPFDKTTLKAIEQGIQASDLGFSPNNDGSVIRIVVPPLSQDRRNELIRQVSKLTEEKGKIIIRGIRQEYKEKVKKQKGSGISEDQIKKNQETLDKLTNKYIAEVEELAKKKEAELLTI